MKSIVTTSALFALLSSSSLLAANLTIPMSFEYLAMDGKEIETNMFSHKAELNLTEGTHKIAIRYHEMVEDDFTDSQSFIKSAPFIVTLKVDGDYQYHLQAAEGEVVKKPKQFAKKPEVVISREDNGQVSYSVELTNVKESSLFDSFFGDSDEMAAQSVAATSPTNKQAAETATASVAPTSAVAATAVVANAASDSTTKTNTQPPANAEQMLQYWWLQADEETRKEFMSWAIKQL
ncbi:DUF2057 domain-containing protein [Shewanella gaetbuli]